MSRFKVGQTVYMNRGDKMRTMIVARVINNPLLPILQYSFESPHDGFACGEQSIRGEIDGRDLTLKECMESAEEFEADAQTYINTIAASRNTTIKDEFFGMSDEFCNLFFQPNKKMVGWLIDYANGRQVVDVGCGQGHLIRLMKAYGHRRIMGIEPNFDYTTSTQIKAERGDTDSINEILPWTVSDAKGLFSKMHNALFIIARPCHGDFIQECISIVNDDCEVLYITLPENIVESDDLGVYDDLKQFLNHEGSSVDGEVVYSIKKQ